MRGILNYQSACALVCGGSPPRCAGELLRNKGGVVVRHAGHKVQYPQIGHIQAVFPARGIGSHERKGARFLITHGIALGEVEAGRNEHIEQPPVERVGADFQRRLLRIVHYLAVKNPPRLAHEPGHILPGVVQQAALKPPFHDGFVIVHERLRDGRNHAPHGRGAQHAGASAVGIHGIKARVIQTLTIQQRRHGGLKIGIGDDAQLARVFHVDNAVADVVRRFQKIRKRMPAPARAFRQPHRAEDFGEKIAFRRIEIELALAHALRFVGGARILHQSGNDWECQAKTAPVLVVLKRVDNAEALGVAVKSRKVGPLCGQQIFEILLFVGGILEPVADGLLARMAKGRVAYVVRQAGGLNDLAQMVRRAPSGRSPRCRRASPTPRPRDRPTQLTSSEWVRRL